jgi:tail assembly chaperone
MNDLTPTEIELEGNWYRLGNIPARTQLHIMRRIAPLQGVTVLSGGSLIHMARVLADMPEADVDYVLDATLLSVTRKSGEGWANIVNAQGGSAFADIGPVLQFKLAQAAIKVFQDPFFAMLADVMKSPETSASTPAAQP